MKKLLSLLTIFAVTCLAFAQDADKVTEILETEKLTYGQAAYICASALGDVASEDEAFSAMKSSGVIAEKHSAGDEINVRNFAHICANTWDVKGSLFLMLFKNPRYAFRQMKADGVIRNGDDGSKALSGRDALNIVNECLRKYELKGGEK